MTARVHGFPVRPSEVLLLDENDRSVLIAPGQDVSHVLNLTARAIWELCDGSTDPEEIVSAICQVFSVAPATARHDVNQALEQLTTAGLIGWTEPSAVSGP